MKTKRRKGESVMQMPSKAFIDACTNVAKLEGKHWCYYIPFAQDLERYGGFVPSLVVANEDGHSPMVGNGNGQAPWVWGKTYDEAEGVCLAVNQHRGISAEVMTKIIESSMFFPFKPYTPEK